jgi:hypothetical protein
MVKVLVNALIFQIVRIEFVQPSAATILLFLIVVFQIDVDFLDLPSLACEFNGFQVGEKNKTNKVKNEREGKRVL